MTDSAQIGTHPGQPAGKSVRLHYLDWLRVILILGVFVYHVVKPFDPMTDWHINNEQESIAAMSFLLLLNPWGLPLFFLVAGAASKFALRRRSNRQYITERVLRLLIPFVVGSILLTPFQRYLEALHNANFQGSFLSFLPEWLSRTASLNQLTPLAFSYWGLHLWFLAFLFAFSLLALPIFRWFHRNAGQRFLSWLGRLVERRGGILLFILPLALARVLVQPFSPVEEHGWLDFVYFFLFFIVGYILYSDDRFLSAVNRDRWLLFAGAMLGLLAYFGLFGIFGDQALDWALTFVVPWSIFIIISFVMVGWGWALNALYLALRYLNRSNRWLEYGNETIMPFYLFHQPVIITIAFFVVQWEIGTTLKILVILISSFLITLGLVEMLIRPFKPVRALFGMKPRKRKEVNLT